MARKFIVRGCLVVAAVLSVACGGRLADGGDAEGDGDGPVGDGDGDGDGDGAPPPPPGDGDGDGDGAGDGDGDGDGQRGDGDGDGDGATFVPVTDGGIPDYCDFMLQDCAEGEKCVWYQSVGDTWDATKCVELVGDGAPGESCTYDGQITGTDSCDVTSMCWDFEDVDGELVGTCLPICDGNWQNPWCPSPYYCLMYGQMQFPALCGVLCDPLAPECSDWQGCYWEGTTFVCANATQDIPEGEPCGYINDCAPGLICTEAELLPSCDGASCCAAFCSVAEPTCQIPDTQCDPFVLENDTMGLFADVGVCRIPG